MPGLTAQETKHVHGENHRTYGDGSRDGKRVRQVWIDEGIEETQKEGWMRRTQASARFQPVLPERKWTNVHGHEFGGDGPNEGTDVQPAEKRTAATDVPTKEDPKTPEQMKEENEVSEKQIEINEAFSSLTRVHFVGFGIIIGEMPGKSCLRAGVLRTELLAKEELGIAGVEASHDSGSLIAIFGEKVLHGNVGFVGGSEDQGGSAFSFHSGQKSRADTPAAKTARHIQKFNKSALEEIVAEHSEAHDLAVQFGYKTQIAADGSFQKRGPGSTILAEKGAEALEISESGGADIHG